MINKFINNYKKAKIKKILINELIIFSVAYMSLIIFFLIFEDIFYFESINREKIFVFCLIALIAFTVYSILKIFINSLSKKSIINNESIALEVGKKIPKLSDKILNAYQLSTLTPLNPVKKELSEITVKETENSMKKYISKEFHPKISIKMKLLFFLSLIFFSLIFYFSEELKFSAYKIYNYDMYFEPPTPFKINIPQQYSFISAMEGDDIDISFKIEGNLTNEVFLFIDDGFKSKKELIDIERDSINYTFSSVKKNFNYRLMSFSESFFSKWDTIKSSVGKINVSYWPEISNIEYVVNAPKYTNLKPTSYGKIQPQFRALKNSKINFKIVPNQELESLKIINEDSTEIKLNKNNSKLWTTSINFDSTLVQKIVLKNSSGRTNKLDYKYKIKLLEDFVPELYVIKPYERLLEINDESELNIEFKLSDDYGLSESWIEFSIIKPDYVSSDSILKYIKIGNYKNTKRLKEDFTWDLSNLNLFPGDQVNFRIVAKDNNPSSNGITKSRQFNALYPSFEDIFTSLEKDEEKINQLSYSTLEEINEIDEILEDIKLDLLKATDVSLENQQKANESLEKMDEVLSEIIKMDEVLDNLKQQADNNNLIDSELMDKFSQFQDLLNDIMTPELLEAMQKMQEALEEMDLSQMLEAVENFDYNLEQFESQIERFIEMFELAIAEQKIDELVASLETMIQEQSKIKDSFNDQESSKKLISMQTRQNERFNDMQDLMDETQESIQKFSEEAATSISDLKSSELNLETQKSLNEAQKKLSENDDNAISSISQSQQNLKQMKKIAEQIKSNFSKDMTKEMISLFFSVIDNIMKLSFNQEELIQASNNIRLSSPKIRNYASNQFIINKQFLKFIEQIMTLSTKTFYVSPDINVKIGSCKKSIDNSIMNLEQRKVKTALNEQKNILASMNEIGLMLIMSMNEMQNSQSASGLSAYMEELQEISQGQSEINMNTMQLGQMGMMQQGDMMRQLQNQQKALQEKLQEILDNLQGQNQGGLSKTSEDMLDVVEDFNQNRVSKETTDKQNKILSRLLDSQKSLKEKDYSDKRKESIARDKPYSESFLIQNELNERNIIYMDAMEDAMEESYSEEYKKMFRKYYRGLLEVED